METLDDRDGSIRKVAVRALGDIADERAVPGLLRALEDKEPSVRKEAFNALCRFNSFQHADPFIEALGGSDAGARKAAALALGKVRDKRAIEPLLIALEDSDPEVRESAQAALARSGNITARVLNATMSSGSEVARRGAARALEMMNHAKVKKRLERSRKLQSPEIWSEIEADISSYPKDRQSSISSFNA